MDFTCIIFALATFSTSIISASHDNYGKIGCILNPDICQIQEYCISDGGLGLCMPDILRDFSRQLSQLHERFPFVDNYEQEKFYTNQDVLWEHKNVNAKRTSNPKSYDLDVVRVVDAVREYIPLDKLSPRQRNELVDSLAQLILLQRKMNNLKMEKYMNEIGQLWSEEYTSEISPIELMLLKHIFDQTHKEEVDRKLNRGGKLSSSEQALLNFLQGWITTGKNQSLDDDKGLQNLNLYGYDKVNGKIDDANSRNAAAQELIVVEDSENPNNDLLNIDKQQTAKRLSKLTGAEENTKDEVITMQLEDDIQKSGDQKLTPKISESYNKPGSQFEAVHDTTENITIYIIVIVIIGVILLVVIIALIWAIVRHIRKKIELKKLMGNDNSSLSDEDYQELCRQRYATKNAETKISAKQNDSIHGKDPFVTKLYQTQKALNSSPSSTVSTPAYVPPYMTDNLTRNSSIASLSWSEEPVTATLDISTGHAILSYMEDHLKNRERLEEEWDGICAYEAEDVTMEIAMLSSNVRKNRTPDSLPFDQNRVKLDPDCNHLGSDYINASLIIDNDPKHPLYIATQGPLSSTIPDFWQVVWEQGCIAIVMLAPIVEESISQCARYWPDEGSCSYDRYEIHLVSEHIWCEDYLVRSLYLKNTTNGETRTVTQFHFLSWPNNGVPQNTKALLELRRKVTKCYKGQSSPVLVHCNDGVGRTGTYILLDLAINRMLKGAKEVNIAATLEHIRDQRQGVVRSKDQFEFALNAVADEVNAILKSLTVTKR